MTTDAVGKELVGMCAEGASSPDFTGVEIE
jgi:hypothetical protein